MAKKKQIANNCEILDYEGNGGNTCSDYYNCCDCGGIDCGCAGCWSCNACETCLEDND